MTHPPYPYFLYDVGLAPSAVAVEDLNGDGHPDLVTANHDSDTISVLLGNGDGSCQDAVDYGVGNGPYRIAIEDLNGNGYPYQYGIRTMTVFDNKLILGTATASEEGCKVFEASAK